MVDFRLKDGRKLDRVALKKSGKFPTGLVSVTSDIGSGYAVGTKAVSRPVLRPATRSGATISADTANKLVTAIGHSQKAIDTCQSLLDSPGGPQPPDKPDAVEASLRRSWEYAIKLTG